MIILHQDHLTLSSRSSVASPWYRVSTLITFQVLPRRRLFNSLLRDVRMSSSFWNRNSSRVT
ncbi:hypothetical protein DPMN_016289 [Dreissena polymorpha]|uniref:Uncharacterized protein n=1 Tax=Dreissena polymorpha TaxID=45954 RepID=A0A9D4N9F0_DREPO|nr:hypothetical protein DPMN_016289 [Dreissena polymorpha]